jgi:hypothetical protein
MPLAGLTRYRRLMHRPILFQLFNTTLENSALILVHEVEALRGHYAEARERLALVAEAGSPRELIRRQRDLAPESRRRRQRDREIRRALVQALARDWRQNLS